MLVVEVFFCAVVAIYKEKAPKAKLIWASSTPPKASSRAKKIHELNALAAKVMKENQISIDDLYALIDGWPKIWHAPSGKKNQMSLW